MLNEKLDSEIVKELEKKGDYETLLRVYQKLLSVFPGSKHLHKLLKGVHDKIYKAQIQEREKYINESIVRINELIKEEKFDSAMQANYELLSYEPKNKKFLRLLKEIQKARNKGINKELTGYFDKIIPDLEKDFQANKEAFIQI